MQITKIVLNVTDETLVVHLGLEFISDKVHTSSICAFLLLVGFEGLSFRERYVGPIGRYTDHKLRSIRAL